MKTIIAFLLLTVGLTVSAQRKQMLGTQVDYVATALKDIPTSSHQIRSTYFSAAVGIFGAITKDAGSQAWQAMASASAEKIKSALTSDGWKISYDLGSTPAVESFQMMITAERGDQQIELLVAMFPSTKGRVDVAYTQSRK